MAGKKEKKTVGRSALPFEQPIEEVRSRLVELEELAERTSHDLSEELEFYRDRLARLTRETYSNLTPWERVQVARHPDRPLTTDYIRALCTDFVELHGDGFYGDDRAMVTGLGILCGKRVLVVGQRKGRTTKGRLECNFGSSHPEGYRKALRKMKLAECMKLPVVVFVNTPGAYPGVGAEERGQARAIAENIYEMFDVRVPIVVVVIGEGGSGGALGIAVGDRIGMLENSWYSVISPEGCASILWRSAEGKEKAAEALKLTATDLEKFGIIDAIIPEPLGGAHTDAEAATRAVGEQIVAWLEELESLDEEELLSRRREKFRHMASATAVLSRAVAEAEAKQDDEPEPDSPGGTDLPVSTRRTGRGVSRRTGKGGGGRG